MPSTSEVCERLDAIDKVTQALRRLDEPYRKTVFMRFYSDLSAEEIARREGIPIATVRTRLRRGLAKLRDNLAKSGALGAIVAILTTPDKGSAAVAANAIGFGALVMTLKAKLITASVAVVIVAGGWLALTPLNDETAVDQRDDGSVDTSSTLEPISDLEAAERLASTEESSDRAPARHAVLSPPIDLSKADRHLDLFGYVIDEDGNPIAGAIVETFAYPWQRVQVLNEEDHDTEMALANTRSSSDGSFLIRFRRGARVNIRASAPSYASAEVPECLAGERVTVVLPRAARLEVVVRDEQGQPVEDVTVGLWRRTPSRFTSDRRKANTGESGRAMIDDLEPGEVKLSFEHHVLGSPMWKTVDVLSEGTSFEITLPAGRTITGRVTDATTGEPIPGAHVGANWVLARAVRTNSDGFYTFPGWTGEGVYHLHVIAEGYGRAENRVPLTGPVDFELEPGDRVTGRLVTCRGDAVASAMVSAMASVIVGGDQQIDTRSSRSEDDGRFELTSLRRDMPHTLVVAARGFGRYLLDFDPHPEVPGLIDLGEIVLPPGQAIEGKVIDGHGEPVADRVVILRGHNADRGRLRPESIAFAYDSYYGKTETSRTDDLGRFRFHDLAPGDYELSSRQQGTPTVKANVVLDSGQPIQECVLQIAGTNYIDVAVSDEAGQGIKNAYVKASWKKPGESKESSLTQLSDSQGRASLYALPDEEIRLRVSGAPNHFGADSKIVRPQGQTVSFVLERKSFVEGTVLAPDGRPLADMLVHARTGTRLVAQDPSNESGRFRLAVREGAVVDLSVSEQRSNPDDYSFEPSPYRGELNGILAPANVTLQTDLETFDRSLEVVVFDPDGKAVAEAPVLVSRRGFGRRATTDSTGRVTLEGLPSEEVQVLAEAPATSQGLLPSERHWVKVDETRVTVHLMKGTLLRGRLLDKNGSAMADTELVFSKPSSSVRTDESGSFSVLVRPAPFYDVEVVFKGNRKIVRGVTPNSGELVIQLENAP